MTRWLNRFSDVGDWLCDRLLDLCFATIETAIDSARTIDLFLDYVVLIIVVSILWVLGVGMFCASGRIGQTRFQLHGWTCQCDLL